uniref:Uncharacterized protein n=1 Tax=Leptobrachium leishanense TaxID=445787 RepID=A0A8C5R086_9ANUR
MPGKGKSMLENLDHFVEILVLSQSVAVKDWGVSRVQRALDWAAYFKHIFLRFQSNESVKVVLEDRLQLKNHQLATSTKNYKCVCFDHLEQSEDILCTNLLQNKALPRDVFKYLISRFNDGCKEEEILCGVDKIIAHKAASHLLSSSGSLQDPLDNPVVLTQAEMLRTSVEGKLKVFERSHQPACVSHVLSGIPPPAIFYLLGCVLITDDGTAIVEEEIPLPSLLLDWLLANSSTWSDFCSNLSCQTLSMLSSKYQRVRDAYLDFLINLGSSMELDLCSGTWVSISSEMTFQTLLDRFKRLSEGGEDLKEAAETTLKRLKLESGDFDVPSLCVWTDLLIGLNKS